jgi:hypothetical protein
MRTGTGVAPISNPFLASFNSSLADQPADTQGGASAYIDDYFCWRTGPSAEENMKRIQEEDIPRIEGWARRDWIQLRGRED